MDEFQRDLAPALGNAQRAAAELLATRAPDDPPHIPPIPDRSIVVDAARVEEALGPLRRFAERHSNERILVSWEVEPGP